jgi:hypothetical protein
VVWAQLHAAFNRRIGSEVLWHGTQAAVLDRGPPLDDEGDRGGPTVGRLPKGVPYERARCLRGIPIEEGTAHSWAIAFECEIISEKPDRGTSVKGS